MADKNFVARNGVVIANSNVSLSNTALTVGNTVANSTSLKINTGASGNATLTSTGLVLANSTETMSLTNLGLSVNTVSVNSTGFFLPNFIANTLGVFTFNGWMKQSEIGVGNTTFNSLLTPFRISVVDATNSANLTPQALAIGNTTVNSIAVSIGSTLSINAQSFSVGNSTFFTSISQLRLQVANSSGVTNVTPTGLITGTSSYGPSGLSIASGNTLANSTFIGFSGGVGLSSNGQFSGNANTATNADLLDGQDSTYYLDLNNSSGTLPSNKMGANTNYTMRSLTANTANVGTLNSNAIINGAVSIGVDGLYTGNASVFVASNSSAVIISDPNITSFFRSTGMSVGQVVANSSGMYVGTASFLNTAVTLSPNTYFSVGGGFVQTGGNTSIYAQLRSSSLTIVNTGIIAIYTAESAVIGTSTVVNGSSISLNNGAGVLNSSGLYFSNNLIVSSTGVFYGNANTASNASALNGQAGSYYLAFGNFSGTLLSAQMNAAVDYKGSILSANNYLYSFGNIYAQGDVYAAYSDIRLKEDFKPLENALEKVTTLSGWTYEHNDLAIRLGYNKNSGRQVGLIAQDVKRVLPEAVSIAAIDVDENGGSRTGENYLSVSYPKLIPLIVEAIKELNDKVDRKWQ